MSREAWADNSEVARLDDIVVVAIMHCVFVDVIVSIAEFDNDAVCWVVVLIVYPCVLIRGVVFIMFTRHTWGQGGHQPLV